ncbi:MAG: hypothetical protein GXO15_01725 [Crenarchaeota archaeon]|nr:hypothetical protein [Thermoproteota archaeon]
MARASRLLAASLAAAAALAVVLLLSSHQGPAAGGGEEAGRLVISYGDWGPLTPFAFYPRGPGYVAASLVFDTLVWKDERGLVPWLAESWESLDGGRVWVFHLRRGVRWSDGEPLTAGDVVFTFEYMSRHGWHWGGVNFSRIESIEAPDPYTVVFRLKGPDPFFAEDVAATVFIIPRHVWEGVGDPYTYRGPGATVGSGPYVVESYEPGRGYVLKANPYWWGPRQLYGTLVLAAPGGITEPRASAEALVSGEADAAAFMGKAWRLVRLVEERVEGVRVEKGPMYWVAFLGFNLDRWPTSSPVFRRAVAYALNLTELVLRAVGSLEAAVPGAPGYVPPYSWFYSPRLPRSFTYDPVEAGRLLEGLGLRDVDGDGCRELPNGTAWRPLLVAPRQLEQEALVVGEMLRRVGVCVRVKTVASFKQLDSLVKGGGFDMVVSGHGAAGNSVKALSWVFTRIAPAWSSGEYRRLAAALAGAASRQEALEAAYAIEELAAGELPRIALYYPYIYLVERPGVEARFFFTWGGIDGGVPLPWNKMALLREEPG